MAKGAVYLCGKSLLDGNALAGDIIKGKTAYSLNVRERITGSLELTGNAGTGDVLSGSTFYNVDPKIRQTGTLVLSGTAAESNVYSGVTFYSNDPKTKRMGTMPVHGAWGTTIAPGASVTIPAGYHNGGGIVSTTRQMTSFTLITDNTGGSSNAPIVSIQACNCPLNKVVYAAYINRANDDARSFYHQCRVSVSTDNGTSWSQIYYSEVNNRNGAIGIGSFNASGTIYTHVKLELWNGTVYNISGLVSAYYQK